MRAALAGEPVLVRNPDAVRPWQHVLNPLSGYLVLAQALWHSQKFAGGWNFGPSDDDAWPVRAIVERLAELWSDKLDWVQDAGAHPHEASYLKLDSSRARERLGWRPQWNLTKGLDSTIGWYRSLSMGEDMRAVTVDQIRAFQHSLTST
jgi:CDP-glucose 4,6-dehydratase